MLRYVDTYLNPNENIWAFHTARARKSFLCTHCSSIQPWNYLVYMYVFTKLLQLLTKFWRAPGLKAVIYFDDGIVAYKGFEAATQASLVVRGSLQRSGLVANV